MAKLIRFVCSATVAALLGSIWAAPPAKSQNYQIDCAILICLAGGWPSSAPCAAARTEFIKRITPWPIEPPLQIWRCPMGASLQMPQANGSGVRLWDAFASAGSPGRNLLRQNMVSVQSLPPKSEVVRPGDPLSLPTDGFIFKLTQGLGGADIDISGPEFNFVRSIRVFDVSYARQSESSIDGDCNRSLSMRIGTYSKQGEFRWQHGSRVSQLPTAHEGLERFGFNCPSIFHRSVFVDWRDYEGNYGYEQVNY